MYYIVLKKNETNESLPCLSINVLQLSQWPMLGSHWVCQGKQGVRVCCVKSRLASDRGLVQINESLCKYDLAAIVNV